MKHGVPWDLAFSLAYADALGMVVTFGELEGGAFDWDSMSWKERR